MFVGANFSTIKRVQEKEARGALQHAILEPVPLRLGELEGIQATAQNPHAALLWFEWMASLEAQRIADEHEPLASSVYVQGGFVEQELRGKKLSVVGWKDQQHLEDLVEKIFQAYGFPKAEGKK
jgi:hypothetical protein